MELKEIKTEERRYLLTLTISELKFLQDVGGYAGSISTIICEKKDYAEDGEEHKKIQKMLEEIYYLKLD